MESLRMFLPVIAIASLGAIPGCTENTDAASANQEEMLAELERREVRFVERLAPNLGVIEWGGVIRFSAMVKGARVENLEVGREYELTLRPTSEEIDGSAVYTLLYAKLKRRLVGNVGEIPGNAAAMSLTTVNDNEYTLKGPGVAIWRTNQRPGDDMSETQFKIEAYEPVSGSSTLDWRSIDPVNIYDGTLWDIREPGEEPDDEPEPQPETTLGFFPIQPGGKRLEGWVVVYGAPEPIYAAQAFCDLADATYSCTFTQPGGNPYGTASFLRPEDDPDWAEGEGIYVPITRTSGHVLTFLLDSINIEEVKRMSDDYPDEWTPP
ncbi:MAG TPA: hypothetical protein VFB62_16715 [Polyangiaceae bacterium]|nr:hypothetical protein [Polyangiaceae bacterium]